MAARMNRAHAPSHWSLEQRRHPRLWPALLQHDALIRSRLADLFLELILDPDRGIALTRQADTGELGTPILLRLSAGPRILASAPGNARACTARDLRQPRRCGVDGVSRPL